MKNIRIILVALIGMLAVGCYNDFETPAPAKVWTDQDMSLLGLTHVSIKEVKDKFGPISGTGTNKDWATTLSLKFGKKVGEEVNFANIREWPEAANFYIKGKVISSEDRGNIYKSLYIWDGTAAIELKLCGNMFTFYQFNHTTLDSHWVYVKLKDLYLGNYRMMLSIGDAPSDSNNTAGTHKYYANSNIDNWLRVLDTVLPGEATKLEMGTDIKVVDNTNYQTLGEADLARLVYFKNVKVRYAGVKNQNGVTNPPMKSGNSENPYPSWIVTDYGVPKFGAWYRWAFNSPEKNIKLYGSVLIGYNDAAVYTSEKGVYSVRTSGFSKFATAPIPEDGAVGNVLGLYAIYSQQSNFQGGSGDFAQYQISVNALDDLQFAKESLLTEEWINANTPASSLNPPVKNNYEEE